MRSLGWRTVKYGEVDLTAGDTDEPVDAKSGRYNGLRTKVRRSVHIRPNPASVLQTQSIFDRRRRIALIH
jgi:hypothetical protein